MTEQVRKFRKKPVVIEAYQVTRAMIDAHLLDDAPLPRGLTTWSAGFHKEDRKVYYWYGRVTTIHGQDAQVVERDWIITEADGEHFYPCKPDIFEATYEPAE